MASPDRIVLSPQAAELVREIAGEMLGGALSLFDEVHEAVMAYAPDDVAADPALAAEIEQSNAAILGHWLAEAHRNPGAFVAPVLTADTLNFARDVARRGLEDMTFNYFRVGLGVASRHVMETAFSVSGDPQVIREALDYMLRSSSEYVDRSAAAIHGAIREERSLRAAGIRARRLDVVLELLEGSADDTVSASRRLGYELDRALLAVILWADPSAGVPVDALEAVAGELAAIVGARRPLVVQSSAASIWVWLAADAVPEAAPMRRALAPVPEVRAAVGSVGSGLAGFRGSHHDAVRTQRVMYRLGASSVVATARDLRVVALAGADEPAAAEFTNATLGALAGAGPVLTDTVRCVIAHAFDTAAAAAELGVHRNTVLARMRRARTLLPEPAAIRWVDVALALELLHWRPSAGRGMGTAGVDRAGVRLGGGVLRGRRRLVDRGERSIVADRRVHIGSLRRDDDLVAARQPRLTERLQGREPRLIGVGARNADRRGELVALRVAALPEALEDALGRALAGADGRRRQQHAEGVLVHVADDVGGAQQAVDRLGEVQEELAIGPLGERCALHAHLDHQQRRGGAPRITSADPCIDGALERAAPQQAGRQIARLKDFAGRSDEVGHLPHIRIIGCEPADFTPLCAGSCIERAERGPRGCAGVPIAPPS